MRSNTSAVTDCSGMKYISRNVNNSNVRLCYITIFFSLPLLYVFFSFLIYTISKENKSVDGEVDESPIAAIVKKILEEAGARNVLVKKRILNVFKKKISILHTAFKQASKSGGNTLNKVVNGWKFGANYKLKVFYHEVDVLKLKSDCDRLRGEKRALEECVTEQAAKWICLEEKLKTVLEKAQKKDDENKRRFKRLAKKVADMCSKKKSRGPAKKKSFQHYTRQHQARVIKQLKEQCHTTL